MNVLLTCAGRRSYLVQFFKKALGNRGRVVACDSTASAPALTEAEQGFIVPPLGHADYVDALAAICKEQRIRLLISVHDLELRLLAQEVGRFRELGTIVVISAPQVIARCQDKWASYNFLRGSKILTPHTCDSIGHTLDDLACGVLRFPLLIKPRWGVSSIGVEIVENDRELTLAYEWGQIQLNRSMVGQLSQAGAEDSFIFQPFLQGQEYGLDVVNDLDGRHVGTLARRKLVMRAGNTDRAITVVEPRFDRLGESIGQHLGHVGGLDCDVIVTEEGCFVVDLNPRFGGGYPFSHLAGANLPAALIAWADDREPHRSWLRPRPGVLSSKYDGLAIVERKPRSTSAGEQIQVLARSGFESISGLIEPAPGKAQWDGDAR